MRSTAGTAWLDVSVTHRFLRRGLFLNEFEVVHPGRALTREDALRSATVDYTRLVSLTDPRAQIRIDRGIRPPYTDQFALGADREVGNNFALGINLVYKRGRNLFGWLDIGGVYAATLADGRVIEVLALW